MTTLARYAIAALLAAFLLFAGVALAGAGHGWVSGGFGCWALAPVGFVACANALRAKPSRRSALVTMVLALGVWMVVGIATRSEGTQYFFRYWALFPIGGLIGAIAYVCPPLLSAVAIARHAHFFGRPDQ